MSISPPPITLLQTLLTLTPASLHPKINAIITELAQKQTSTLESEIALWKRGNDDRSLFFADALERIQIAWKEESDLVPVIETTQDILDEIWRQQSFAPMQQTQMTQILMIIEALTTQTLVNKINRAKIWINTKEGIILLRNSLAAATTLLTTLNNLTFILWPSFAFNAWRGPPYTDTAFQQMAKRLQEAIIILASNQQIAELTESDDSEKRIHRSLKIFEDLGSQCWNGGEETWKNAVLSYDAQIAPYTPIIVGALSSILNNLTDQPMQLLRVINQYAELVKRDDVRRNMNTEREILLGHLIRTVATMGVEVRSRFKKDQTDMQNIVVELAWMQQASHKLEQTNNIVGNFLADVGNYKDYQILSSSLSGDLQTMQSDYFSKWCQHMEFMMSESSSDEMFQKNGKLMELDLRSGKLRVNYSDTVIMALRQVRQLLSMGYSVPIKLQKNLETAREYYRHGIVLKQIAHFYNTIDQQIIPSQKVMLLERAMQFEAVIKNPTNNAAGGMITWQNTDQVEQCIAKLQESADRLSAENSRLRSVHESLVTQVKTLFDISLVKDASKWKDVLQSIRVTMAEVENSGVKAENMLNWKMHWDHQLYKALNMQYRTGIQALHESLSTIRIEIVFAQQRVQLKPSFEEIRARYYKEMKKFITIPLLFKGVSDKVNFAPIVDINSASVAMAYEKAETLLRSLAKLPEKYQEWISIGMVDMTALARETLVTTADWQLNFKAIKSKGRDTSQIPSSINVDCFEISLVSFKQSVDELSQKLFEVLTSELKGKISTTLEDMDEFVEESIVTLTSKVKSLQEIGAMNIKYEEIKAKRTQMKEQMTLAEANNTLLRTVTGYGHDFIGVSNRADKLDLVLQSHDMIVNEQIDGLKRIVEEKCQMMFSSLSIFEIKWSEIQLLMTQSTSAIDPATMTRITELQAEFKDIEGANTEISLSCEQFKIQKPNTDRVDALARELSDFQGVFALMADFRSDMSAVMCEDWMSFRSKYQSFEETLKRWTERLSSMTRTPLVQQILRECEMYKGVLPLLKLLRGDTWSTEHWIEALKLIGMPASVTMSSLTFGDLLSHSENIRQNTAGVKDINARAQGEIAIREALQDLQQWASTNMLSSNPFIDSKGNTLHVIKDWKDTLTQLGDNRSLLGSLHDSPFYQAFASQVEAWDAKLSATDEILNEFCHAQRKWIYLEPILGKGALPSETARFSQTDSEFRKFLMYIHEEPRAMRVIGYSNALTKLQTIGEQLDQCQRALSEFLEQKRSNFARFYFLGDEDLLEILGQASNPVVIQSHLKKLFAGIYSVRFDTAMKKIEAMISQEGEIVVLNKPIQIGDKVEQWLQALAVEMRATLKTQLTKCVDFSDLQQYPQQILDAAEAVNFTQQCEKAIANGELTRLKTQMVAQLERYTKFDTSAITPEKAKRVVEMKLKSLIFDTIHYTHMCQQLIDHEVTSIDDWQWKKQLRMYLDSDGACLIRMSSNEFKYTYEYQGNPIKLVHTPLTDKCYLTLTEAMANGFGGNPFGPAGTGKTESVKALGYLFGRQVLVFNCDEGIDYKSMARIFVGLVKCGAWGCFDEFNRLEEAVLSAVSQQIQTIQHAIEYKTPTVNLLGQVAELDPNSAIFVTLNPAGKGYGGRSKLPDNLKQMFRSVAMAAPDNELIAEVILTSEGYLNGKDLGIKLVTAYKLCQQLLSPQQHYDWGLRPLRAVLGLAGNILREELKNSSKKATLDLESNSLVRSLRISTSSKLTHADVMRFDDLIRDTFANVKLEAISVPALEVVLPEAFATLGLMYNEKQQSKVLELYESLQQRMGVAIVGDSGSGKSVLWKVLNQALSTMQQRIVIHNINPKAVHRKALLGHMDLDTRDWTDGILTAAARQAVKESADTTTWIICDGDVDPEWIESLNSVLDDNRLLTIPNGERIQFLKNVNFIFETSDLSFASPATVSRMAMIFLSAETTEVKAVVQGWLSQRNPDRKNFLEPLIESFYYETLKLAKIVPSNIDLSVIGQARNGLSQLDTVNSPEELLLALIRGFGGNMEPIHRAEFASRVLALSPSTSRYSREAANCYYDSESKQLQSFSDSNELTSVGGLVKTKTVQAALSTLTPWIKLGQPFLMIGPPGIGKNTILRSALDSVPGTGSCTVWCTSRTSSYDIVARIKSACSTYSSTKGKVLRPKGCERLVVHIKNIDLPKTDKYNTSEIVSFLQQVLTYQGFYDASLEWLGLENVLVVASMTQFSAKSVLSPRFTSIINHYVLPEPDAKELDLISAVYASATLKKLKSSFKTESELHAKCLVTIYNETKKRFRAEIRSHYIFTPKNLLSWIQAPLRYRAPSDLGELISIYVYEAGRIFGDKLVTLEEQNTYDHLINTNLWAPNEMQGIKNDQILYIPDNFRGSTMTPVKLEKVTQELFTRSGSYNNDVGPLQFVITAEMTHLVTKMLRTLCYAEGHVLNVARAGSGRKSALRLISYITEVPIIQFTMGRPFQSKVFFAELKNVITKAITGNEKFIILLEDQHMTQTLIADSMTSLITAGEVQGLFTAEEQTALLGALKSEHDGYSGNVQELYQLRIRQNIHAVILLDAQSPIITILSRNNPLLFTGCHCIWTDSIQESTLQAVSISRLEAKVSSEITQHLNLIHKSVRIGSSSPKQFYALVDVYSKIYIDQFEILTQKYKYLMGGLSKLLEASNAVGVLQIQASKQGAVLAEKQKQADEALKQITSSMVNAGNQKAEMELLTVELKKEEAVTMTQKLEIEAQLSEVEPLIRRAKESVGDIKSENLSEIRSLRAPPAVVRDILEGVLKLMGNMDTSWTSMKSFLGKRTVKEEILNFDARSITPKIREAVEELLRVKSDSFEEANAKRSSAACAPLATWVKALLQYSVVIEKVAPMEATLKKFSNSLEASRNRLRSLQTELDTVDTTVAQLKSDFSSRTQEAEVLKVGLTQSEETLASAEHLLSQLEGEKTRWQQQTEEIQGNIKALPQAVCIAAAFVTYLSGVGSEARARLLAEWNKITGLPPVSFGAFLSSERQNVEWRMQGLPSDEPSQENAIVIQQGTQTPMIIDPTGQALSWARETMKTTAFEHVAQADESLIRSLELCLRFGKAIIISDIIDLEPILYPVIRKEFTRNGSRLIVSLGEKQVECHENFRMLLFTRNPDYIIPANLIGWINPVNFAMTTAGLSSQLLSVALSHENPALEEQQLQLVKQDAESRLQLDVLEDTLLKELATSQGNILQNKALLDSLSESKAKTKVIAEALRESDLVRARIEAERELFKPLSTSVAAMYQSVAQLGQINNMYQFSFKYYLQLFRNSLANDKDSTLDTSLRVTSLISSFKRVLYNAVMGGLFRRDRSTFAMHCIKTIEPITSVEWLFFKGEIVKGLDTEKVSTPAWLQPSRTAVYKSFVSTFESLCKDIDLASDSAWTEWYHAAAPEESIPAKHAKKLNQFQRLLLLQVCRPDRLESAVNQYIIRKFSVENATIVSTESIYRGLSHTQPLLFILTPGADPSRDIKELAAKQGVSTGIVEICLGQGQSGAALEAITTSAKQGTWLCLHNLHLVTAWLPQLEANIVSICKDESTHSGFRLFMTSEEHPRFPASLLQLCLKVTVEAPSGLKANMERSIGIWSSNKTQSSILKMHSLFSVTWFHAIIQERRTYNPAGWAKFYEFSSADLGSAVRLIDKVEFGDVRILSMAQICGLLLEAIYGARIDNVFDMRTLKSYLSLYMQKGKGFYVDGCLQLLTLTEESLLKLSNGKKMFQGPDLPQSQDPAQYTDIVLNLPQIDSATTFGLPANSDRAVQIANTNYMIQSLVILDSPVNNTSIWNRLSWSNSLKPILNTWKETAIAIKSGSKPFIPFAAINPAHSLISREAATAHRLLTAIATKVEELGDAIEGKIAVTPALILLGNNLIRYETPDEWTDIWDGPTNLTAFLRGFAQKYQQVSKWYQHILRDAEDSIGAQTLRNLLDAFKQSDQMTGLRLGDLFNPQVFLGAFRQISAREGKCSVADLSLETYTGSVPSGCFGINLHKVLLNGVTLDGKQLQSVSRDSPDVFTLKNLSIAWVRKIETKDRLEVPLFHDTTRARYIGSLRLQCDDLETWNLSGCCACLEEAQA